MSDSIVNLHDKVLEFLLNYREVDDPNLKFVTRRSNTGAGLDAGRWFLDGKGYLLLNFWSGPAYLSFRIFEDGLTSLVETIPVKISKNQRSALRKAIVFTNKKEKNYQTKTYSEKGDDHLSGLKLFLDGDRRKIDKVVEENPVNLPEDELEEPKGLGFIDSTEFNIALQTIDEFRKRRRAEPEIFPLLSPSSPRKGQPAFALESIVIRNFQGIENSEIINLPRANWVFLTGNNGFGKTSVLRGIFIALYGKQDDNELLASERSSFSVRFWDGSKLPFSIDTKTKGPLRSLAAYGSSRLNITGKDSRDDERGKNRPSYSLFNTDGALRSIENRLRHWYSYDRDRYDSVVDTLKNLMPGIESIDYEPTPSDKIFYLEKASKPHERLEFEKLASGFRSIIAMIGDMIVRFFETDPSAKKPEDCKGIVLIDELDLHLHPIWQRQLPQLLSKVFPKIQFIVSTHSPIPFLGAPKDAVFLKVNRSLEEGITVELLEIDVSELLPNTILTSPIFGLQDIFPISFDGKSQRIRTEATFEEKKLNDQVKKRLKDFEGSDKEAELIKVFKFD